MLKNDEVGGVGEKWWFSMSPKEFHKWVNPKNKPKEKGSKQMKVGEAHKW
jgi:hypothetical protein